MRRDLAFAVLLLCLAAPLRTALAAPARPAALAGHVVGIDGAPVPGARVALVAHLPSDEPSAFPDAIRPREALAECVTSAEGAFALEDPGWPAGFARLRVEGDGLASTTTPLVVALGAGALPRDLELVAPKAVTLTGLVLDETGAPAPGVRVGVRARSVLGDAAATTTSGADGTFAFRGLPGLAGAALVAMRDDGALARGGTWLPDAGTTRIALHLEELVELSGTLLRFSSGAAVPVANAPILVTAQARASVGPTWTVSGGFAAALLRRATTDEAGRYRIMAPRVVQATLAVPGLGAADLSGGRQLVTALPPVTGLVTDASGKPVAGALVGLYGRSTQRVTTDERGRFTLPRPPSGADSLEVLAPGLLGPRTFPVPGVSRPARLSLPRGVLGGIVREPPREDGTPGAPVPGALVLLRTKQGQLVATATDADGRFAVPGLPAGTIEICARVQDRAGSAHGRAGLGADAEIVLAPTATLAARIVDDQGGAAGAVVLLRPVKAADLPRILRPKTPGSVSVAGLLPGEWAAGALLPGPRFAAVGDAVTLPAKPDASPVEIKGAASGRLAVTCVDGTGAPVDGALVVLNRSRFQDSADIRRSNTRSIDLAVLLLPEGSSGFESASTGPDGRAVLDGLPLGTCLPWMAVRPGFVAPETECVTIPADRVAETRVVLQPAATLRATVLAPDGTPVAGAGVLVGADPSKSARPSDAPRGMRAFRSMALADAEGRAIVRGLAEGRFVARGCAPGFLPSEKTPVDVAAGGQASVVLTLGEAATLQGRVVESSGAPAADATIRLEHDAPRDAYVGFYPQAAVGDDGRFVVEGLVPGSPVTLTAERAGDVSPPRRAVPGDEAVTLTLVARGRITGTVLRDGTAVASAGIECESGQKKAGQVRSGDDGGFELAGLAPGEWSCTATAEERGAGRVEGLIVDAGAATPTTIVLRDPRTLSVSVRDARTQAPVAGASVDISMSNAATTDDTGSATLSLPPWVADAKVSARKQGYGWSSSPVPPAPESSLLITLTKLPSVKGLVLGPDGAPAVGATVNGTDVDAEGRFSIDANGPGPFRLLAARATGKERQEATRVVEVPDEGLDGVTLRLESLETGSVVITVRDGEAPAAGAAVRVVAEALGGAATQWGVQNMWFSDSASRSSQAMGTADAEGRFSAELLPPGNYAVLAARKGGQILGRAGSVSVVPGQATDASVSLPPEITIRGRVTRSGRPVEAASIGIELGAMWWSQDSVARTEADGTFETQPLPESVGEMRVNIAPPQPSLPDDVPRVTRVVTLGSSAPEPLIIDLTGVSVSGVVTATGEPVKNATVSIALVGEERSWRGFSFTTRSDAAGAFTLRGVPPGATADVTASLSPHEPATERVTLPASGSIGPLQLALGDTGGIRGTATAGAGPATTAITFMLEREDGARLRPSAVTPGAGGAFVLPVPADAAYRYRATTAGQAPLLGFVEAGAPLALAFSPGGRLELTLSDADGARIEGAQATLVSLDAAPPDEFLIPSALSSGIGFGAGTSDAAGRLLLSALTPGAYRLRVTRGDLSAEVAATITDGQVTRLAATLVRAAP